MINLRLARKNREVNPQSWTNLYEKLVSQKIRERYSIDQELALHRQRDEKPEEFAEYYAYVEQCKTEIKELMND